MFWGSKKFLIILILANLFLVFFGTYLFINIKNTIEKVSLVEQEIEERKNRQDILSANSKMLEDSSESLKKIDSYFVKKDGEAGFIGYIEKIGRDIGINLSIENVGVDAVSTDTDFKDNLKVRVAISGSWNGVLRFLGLLEDAPYAIGISALQISPSQDTFLGKKVVSGSWSGYVDISVPKLK